jgi:hypothetical protein
MFKRVIFQELCVTSGDIIQLIPFVCAFYAFESPLFYSHRNCDGDVIMIPFAMGIHQCDHLGGALFVLACFMKLHSTTKHFPFYLSPSNINNTHIIAPFSIVSFAYEHFQIEFHAIGLSIQPKKCVTWSPSSLPPYFSTPS